MYVMTLTIVCTKSKRYKDNNQCELSAYVFTVLTSPHLADSPLLPAVLSDSPAQRTGTRAMIHTKDGESLHGSDCPSLHP